MTVITAQELAKFTSEVNFQGQQQIISAAIRMATGALVRSESSGTARLSGIEAAS
jgi:hypothetical protein